MPTRDAAGELGPQRYEPDYRIALLSLRVDPAFGEHAATFVIEIDPAQ